MKKMKNYAITSLLTLTLCATVAQTANATNANSTYTAQETPSISGFYNGENTLNAELISRFSVDSSYEDGGLLEIVTYNSKSQIAYAVAGTLGELLLIPMNTVDSSGLSGTGIDMKSLVGEIEGFVYGDMSSIAINQDNSKLAVALQAESYNDDGMVALFTLLEDGSLGENPSFIPCGKQPDALCFTPDGSTILVANEGEPREGYGAGVIDPEGSVTLIDVSSGASTHVSFQGVTYDEKVLLQTGSTPSEDFEPEYIACNNEIAYVALQENNAIAILDIQSAQFTGVYGLGLQDYSTTKIDMVADGNIHFETQENVYGVYMPDGITLFQIDGKDYLFTANEGDGREWGDEDGEFFYCNEYKDPTSPTGSVTVEKKVTWLNPSDYEMLDQNSAYLYGARSFSIWEVEDSGISLVYDSGSEFEELTAELLPDYFNCSNDDISLEDRSGKKGSEPEYVAMGEVGENIYAFIGLERQGGVMMYDVTNPTETTFINYISSRDYSKNIAGDVAPEGIYFVNGSESATGEPLILVANEVSGTLAVIEVSTSSAQEEAPEILEEVPEIEMAETDATPQTETPPVVVEESVVEATKNYSILSGDTLWNIASRELGVGQRWSEILDLNSQIKDVRSLQIGQNILIPFA